MSKKDCKALLDYEKWGEMKPIAELLDEQIERKAEKSIRRDMYELHEADARVRHFKDGANSLKPLILELVEALEFYADVESWEYENPQSATYSRILKEDHGHGDFQFNDITDDSRVGGLKSRLALQKLRKELEDEASIFEK